MKILSSVYSRRKLFKLGTASVMAASVSLVSACNFFESENPTIVQRLIQTLNHIERAQDIGNAYLSLDSTIDLNSSEQLTQTLLERLNLNSEEIQKLSDKKLIKHLSQKIRDDFANENVVIMGSWMFSKTEAMLCALADLHQQSEKNKS